MANPMGRISELDESEALTSGHPKRAPFEEFLSILLEKSGDDVGLQVYYCEYLIRNYFYGSSSKSDLTKLRSLLYNIENETENKNIRRLALLSIGLYYIESDDYYSLDGVLKDWSLELNVNSQFYYLSSRRLLEEPSQNNINTAIEDAFEAKKQSPVDYFRYNISYVLLTACNEGFEYSGDKKEIPSQTNVMLEVAKDMIETALNRQKFSPDFYLTKAKISIFTNEWTEAKTAISEGLTSLRKTRYDYTEISLEFRILEHQLKSETQRKELEDEISGLIVDTKTIRNEIGSLTELVRRETEKVEDLDQEIENNRVRFLQFLGFFAALLAVAITSTQIIATVDDFEIGIRLVISLTGALLVAFGGFSTMFVKVKAPTSWIPPIIMIFIGSLGIVASLYIPTI